MTTTLSGISLLGDPRLTSQPRLVRLSVEALRPVGLVPEEASLLSRRLQSQTRMISVI
jgi:hypothetical protein